MICDCHISKNSFAVSTFTCWIPATKSCIKIFANRTKDKIIERATHDVRYVFELE